MWLCARSDAGAIPLALDVCESLMSSSDLNGEGGYALCTAATAVHFIVQQPKGGGIPAAGAAADGGSVFDEEPAEPTAIMLDGNTPQGDLASLDLERPPSPIAIMVHCAAERAYDQPDGSQST